MEPSAAVEEVLSAEREWLHAHLRLDVQALDRLMAPDYAQIDASGRVVEREQVIASLRSGERSWDEAHSDEHRVRFYGDDVAVVVGRWRARGTNAGRAFDYAARFVAVWVCRDGRWLMVSDQATPIASTG
ncbi:MAG: nuclear transport factor 2 family protein [Actinomycetota bacterium]|nr:nuclear transport factor 2 family protein [Actinomycetota bacterium]